MRVCMYSMYVAVCVFIHVYACMHNISGGIVSVGKCPTQNGKGNCPGGNCPGGNCPGGIVLYPSLVLYSNGVGRSLKNQIRMPKDF